MPTSRYQDKVLETYARSLLEAAKAENHVFEDLEMIERLASASPEIIAVLDTMSKRDQLDLLPKVAAAFKYVAEEDEDVVGVTVTTAIPLDDELRQTITKKCEQDFGRKVFLIRQVDPSIVGGLVLEARGERRDISVKTQLRIAQETSQTLLIRTEVKPNVRNPQCPGYRQETAGAAHEPLRDGRYA